MKLPDVIGPAAAQLSGGSAAIRPCGHFQQFFQAACVLKDAELHAGERISLRILFADSDAACQGRIHHALGPAHPDRGFKINCYSPGDRRARAISLGKGRLHHGVDACIQIRQLGKPGCIRRPQLTGQSLAFFIVQGEDGAGEALPILILFQNLQGAFGRPGRHRTSHQQVLHGAVSGGPDCCGDRARKIFHRLRKLLGNLTQDTFPRLLNSTLRASCQLIELLIPADYPVVIGREIRMGQDRADILLKGRTEKIIGRRKLAHIPDG